MLVLSRKIGERILIGDGIVVTVLDVRGSHVRIGVEAPANVPIWRSELRQFDADPAPSHSKGRVLQESANH